jgi:hypothetical protein
MQIKLTVALAVFLIKLTDNEMPSYVSCGEGTKEWEVSFVSHLNVHHETRASPLPQQVPCEVFPKGNSSHAERAMWSNADSLISCSSRKLEVINAHP